MQKGVIQGLLALTALLLSETALLTLICLISPCLGALLGLILFTVVDYTVCHPAKKQAKCSSAGEMLTLVPVTESEMPETPLAALA